MHKKYIRVLAGVLAGVVLFTGCSERKVKEESEPEIKEDAYLEQQADQIANEFTKGEYTLYYTNEERTQLEETKVYFDFTEVSLSKEIESILNSLANIRSMEEFQGTANYSIIPEGMVMAYGVDEQDIGNIVKVYMTNGYYQLKPNEIVIMKTGINKAIYNLGLVNSIEYFVKTEKDTVLVDYSTSTEQVLLNQYDNNFYTDNVTLKLYFADANEEGLVMEEREVTLKMTDTMQEAVVKELIAGPKIEGTQNLIPEGTKVNSVWVKDGVCYVDLSSEFQARFIGSGNDEEHLIYSIVNSLCRLSGIQYVQILVDGERIDIFYSNVSINSTLTANEELVLSQAE